MKVPDVMTNILKRGKTLDGYSILELPIDPGEIEAVKLVNNQLESLRRFGLVEETAIILHRWIVAQRLVTKRASRRYLSTTSEDD